ncbi:hypothetical protein O181_069374, partial [Austropuccinia psidii MF-1]|nr:hypothetical protein [Austropuccinia psidii MF-1]
LSATLRFIIIINSMPVGSHQPIPLPLLTGAFPQDTSHCLFPPAQGTPHYNNETLQEFTYLQPTLMITQAIVHK